MDGFATGPVLLYMDDSKAYRCDKEALDHAFCKPFRESLEHDTQRVITERLKARHGSDQFDVVADFAEPVVAQVVARHFFGFTPDDEQLLDFRQQLRTLGSALIDGEISGRAQRAADAIIELANSRKRFPEETDLAARLHQSSNPTITSATGSVAGLSLAASATVARGLGQVVDRLVNDQDLQKQIKQAVDTQTCNSDFLIDQLVRESLRFAPVLVFIRRYTLRDVTLTPASGGKTLRRGTRVLVGLSSAMFDESAFPCPNDFRLDRPADSYVHFGYGLHRCYGSLLAEMFLRSMIKALLRENILAGAHTDSSQFESWALTRYRIKLASGASGVR